MNQQQTNQQDSNRKQMNIPPVYLVAVMEIVREVRRLCLLPPTTTDKLRKDSESWCRMLFGVIPLQSLDDCFVRAYREHKAGSFFECASLINQWWMIKAGRTDTSTYSLACVLCRSHDNGSSLRPCPFHQAGRPTCYNCGVPNDVLPLISANDIEEQRQNFGECQVCKRYTIPIQIVRDKIDRMIAPPPTQTMIDDAEPSTNFIEERLKESVMCNAKTTLWSDTKQGVVVHCQLGYGHEGEHLFHGDNNSQELSQSRPCPECFIPLNMTLANPEAAEFFTMCPTCGRQTKSVSKERLGEKD